MEKFIVNCFPWITCQIQVGNSYLYDELMKIQTDLSPTEFGLQLRVGCLRCSSGGGGGGLGAELSAVLRGLHICLFCLPANPEDSTQHKPINISGAQSSEMGKNLSKIRRVRYGGTRTWTHTACFQNMLIHSLYEQCLQFMMHNKNIKSFIETYHLGLYLFFCQMKIVCRL